MTPMLPLMITVSCAQANKNPHGRPNARDKYT